MDRRAFLKLFGGAAAGAVIAPAIPFNRVWSFAQKLTLWQFRKRYIVPAAVDFEREVRGNVFLTVDWITRENLRMLIRQFELEQFADFHFMNGAKWEKPLKVGSVISIRRPARFHLTLDQTAPTLSPSAELVASPFSAASLHDPAEP